MPDFVKQQWLPIVIALEPWAPLVEAPGRGGREAVPDRFRSGTVVSTPYEGGREVQSDTLTCCHCGFTWVPAPGSGRRRGFCFRCNGHICGRFCCDQLGCIPGGQARIIENIEQGLPINYVPVSVSVPTLPSVLG